MSEWAQAAKRCSVQPTASIARFVIPIKENEMTERTLTLGDELFRFTSEQEWVNKAQSWFRNKAPQKGNYIAVDEVGRVCTCGKHFMRATTEETYPITVYELTV